MASSASKVQPIRRLLVANRGEIARRIFRTCRRLGISTIAVYSEADREMPFVREADEAYLLPGFTPSETYLNGEKLLEIAQRAQADAIHPGYGFLSENAAFARAVTAAGLTFIGPSPEAIEKMGSKSLAKALMEAQGIPTVPGFRKAEASLKEFAEAAEQIGYPVLLKAAAGGGGKGMRIVSAPDQLANAYESARRETQSAFGDAELLLERYFPSARHIEVQILGDTHGNLLHLFERECTIQRRYQKIVEESPSPALSPHDREQLTAAAVRAAQAINYHNAGTVEFLYAGPGEFYFLEVNTRLQVEHPVTEAILGIDLVEWQIRIAQGEALPWKQSDLRPEGYAVEFRLYAEDPSADFRPATGRILAWQVPDLPYLRADSGIETGVLVSPYYDPLLAKLILWGPTRAEALQRAEYALARIQAIGLRHNLFLLRALCSDPDFQAGRYDTHFLERKAHLLQEPPLSPAQAQAAAIGLSLWRIQKQVQKRTFLPTFPVNWRNTLQKPLPYGWRIGDALLTVEVQALSEGLFRCITTETEGTARLLAWHPSHITFEWQGQRLSFAVWEAEETYWLHCPAWGTRTAKLLPRFPEIAAAETPGSYTAPMPGQITEIFVQPGDSVEPGQPLLVFLSMKMENRITAAEAGQVEALYVQKGQTVEAGTLLLQIKPV